MPPAFYALLSMLGVLFRSQLSLRPRASLRETSWQICQRTVKRPIIRPEDLILWFLAIALPGKVARRARL